MSRPHAVVTGGAGFLGSHLVDALLNDGYRVTSIDNFGSGRPTNLDHINSNRFESVEHDVRDPFPTFESVDQVYHFASRASPDDFESHPVEIAQANSDGARYAIECAIENDAILILASTSEVYGDPEVHPQHEAYNGNVNPRGPRAPYDEGKRFAEALSIAYQTEYDVDIRTIRIFNTYGPRMRRDDGRVIPNFLSQSLNGDDLTVYGDGSQTRSFCFVDDLIAGVRAIAESDAEVARGEVFNLGSTEEISIVDLAETVLDVIETDSDIVYQPLPEDDPQMRRPDISKIKDQLGWAPSTPLREGLHQTMTIFDEQA